MDKASKAVRSSRTYKERSQPQERKKWGLLEKHKDYSARARSFRTKQRSLQTLRQKAADRNPDEFYFGMVNTSGPSALNKKGTGMLSGKTKGENEHSIEAMRLYKTQDMGYVRGARNIAGKEVRELEERCRAVKGWEKGRGGGKIVFVEGMEEVVGLEEEDDDEEVEEEPEIRKRRNVKEKERLKLENRLQNAKARLKALAEAEEALDLQRAKMGKSPTVGGVNKHGARFKIRERKR